MNSIHTTKREKIFLIVVLLLLPVVFTVPQETLDQYEMLFIFFIVVPLGYLIATDPERIK